MTAPLRFTLEHADAGSHARAGRIETRRGVIETPIFMPVGTLGTVRTVSPDELEALGAQIILSNTYHLYLRPGMDVIGHFDGLHRYMDWSGPILTDSGGFQFFSLKENARFRDEGVEFKSHLNGDRHFFSPEKVIEIQRTIGSDIMMVLDQCLPLPAEERELEVAIRRTTEWAIRSLEARREADGAVFAILQGGTSVALRQRQVEDLCGLDFHGFALGGLAVGEESRAMYDTIEATAPDMPADKPRYLMGVGKPEDLIEAIGRGVDMFDCVLPTRNARNGQVLTRRGKFNMRNGRWSHDDDPIDAECSCLACRRFSRGYVQHLIRAREMFGFRLTTLHNLTYYLDLVRGARAAVLEDRFDAYRRSCYDGWSARG